MKSKILADCTPLIVDLRNRGADDWPLQAAAEILIRLYNYACKLEAALQEIDEKTNRSKNADWARRRAVEAITTEHKEEL